MNEIRIDFKILTEENENIGKQEAIFFVLKELDLYSDYMNLDSLYDLICECYDKKIILLNYDLLKEYDFSKDFFEVFLDASLIFDIDISFMHS